MPYVFRIILLVLLGVPLALRAQSEKEKLGVIPAPAEVRMAAGFFRIDSRTRLWYSDETAKKTAVQLNDYLQKNHGLTLQLKQGQGQAQGNTLAFSTTASLGPEAYTLQSGPGGIRISGDAAGLFYGLQTLLQMCSKTGGQLRVAAAEISDRPRYAFRGIMQDVGYHIYPVSFIKSQIDMLAKYKMNVYHWHLTEDHGWRIEIKKYPKLTSIGAYRESTQISHYTDSLTGQDHQPYGGFYSQDEIRDVVAYAAARNVTVIPEIELPGHSLAALAAYPEMACGDKPGPFKVAQNWGIFEDVYCAGKEQTFHFLQDVLTEVMDLFPSRYIHIGGDECPKERWKACKYCQQRIRAEGLKNEFELQSYFVKRIERFVNGKGRQIIGWDEIREGGLAPNATVMAWRSIDEGIKAAQENHDVVMAPMSHVYFDFLQGPRDREPLAIGWGFNPAERVYAYDPTPAQLTADQKKHIIGVEAPIWTEHMDTHRKVEYMLYPRLMALAEIAWTFPERKDSVDFFEHRLPKHLAELDQSDIVYRVPGPIGLRDTTLQGSKFTISLRPPVSGAKIYYNFDGQDARETDYLYEKPFDVILKKGEKRQMKSVVVTPSGKRSAGTTTLFRNP
ncbi:beta-N-acetylhexosaminidase [Pedobacter yulinensis]|uniref:beta-N-acetylhexosaminidase n=2 Tax=Pedobacter yulinensis TaxID=2126353 RepID=A0A2T3HMY6_9SPHI|nr:beta-N-acetylhexosaminidase [Pedobacter yulinensis]